jgi:acyl-CoA synthetase (AMP-forming)/AMP-acid ligase II/aryl carrier-like protein
MSQSHNQGNETPASQTLSPRDKLKQMLLKKQQQQQAQQPGFKAKLTSLAQQSPARVAIVNQGEVSYQALLTWLNDDGDQQQTCPAVDSALSPLLNLLRQWWQQQTVVVIDRDWSQPWQDFVLAPLNHYQQQQKQDQQKPLLWCKYGTSWWGLNEQQLLPQLSQAGALFDLSAGRCIGFGPGPDDAQQLMILLASLYGGATIVGSPADHGCDRPCDQYFANAGHPDATVAPSFNPLNQAKGYAWHPACGYWAQQGKVTRRPGQTLQTLDRLGYPLPQGAIGQLVCQLTSNTVPEVAIVEQAVVAQGQPQNKGKLITLGLSGQINLDDRLVVDIDQSAMALVEGVLTNSHEIGAFLQLSLPLKALKVLFRQTGQDNQTGQSNSCCVIYVVAAHGQSGVMTKTLIAFLPAHLQSQHIVELAALPLTTEGQVDVKALQGLGLVSQRQLALWSESQDQPLSLAAVKPVRPDGELPPLSHFVVPEQAGSSADALLIGEPVIQSKPNIHLLRDCLLEAAQQPEQLIDFIATTGTTRYSYRQLLDQAAIVAGGLTQQQVSPGQPLIVLLPDNIEFCVLFWACQLSGIVPVFCEWPDGTERQQGALQKLQYVNSMMDDALIVTTGSILAQLQQQIPDTALLDFATLSAAEPLTDYPVTDPDAPAVLLLTSGSTGKPKMVPQSHRAILTRTRACAVRNDFTPADISFNWMPLDHVGAIVMFHVCDTFMAIKQIHADTTLVLQQPLLWLALMAQYRVSVTWAPNFAFQLVNEQLARATDKPWDLSALRFILNAGEAIQARTTRLFMDNLADCGLNSQAMKPCWGMSETCSGVTYDHQYDGRFADASAEFVSVGFPVPGFSVRIVNPEGNEADHRLCQQDQIGALQVKGDNVLAGYHLNAQENQRSFTADGWFDTGDLAKITEQGLFITGRQKELIIINGVNYSCQEIESVVTHSQLVQPGDIAACPVQLAHQREASALFVVAKPDHDQDQAQHSLANQIRQLVFEQTQLALDYIVFLAPEQLPKSNIGKILRAALRQQFTNGVWQQETVSFTNESRDDTDPLWFATQSLLPLDLTQARHQSSRLMQLGTPPMNVNQQDPVIPLDDAMASTVANLLATSEDTRLRLALWWPAGNTDANADAEAYRQVLRLVIQCHQSHPLLSAHLWVFCDEQATGLPGFLRSINKEYPLWQICLVSARGDAVDWQHIFTVETNAVGNVSDILYVDERRYQPKLSQPKTLPTPGKLPFETGSTWLVYGGLSDMVRPLVDFLLQHYQAKVVLFGRRPESEVTGQTARFYDPARLLYRQLDITDKAQVNASLATIPQLWRDSLQGMIHAAGSYQECAINAIDTAHWQTSVGPKMQGLDHIIALGQTVLPAQGVLIQLSSVNGYFGGSGVTAYATANSYQQQTSQQLNRQGQLSSYCMLFSAWQDTGMSRQVASLAASAANGFDVMPADTAFRSLLWCLGQPQGEWLVGVDTAHPALANDSLSGPVALYEVRQNVPEGVSEAVDESGRACTFKTQGNQSSAIDTTACSQIEQQVAQCWQTSLDHTDFGLDDNYFAVGGNSIRLLQLREQLQKVCGRSLELTDLFRFTTVRTIADFLGQQGGDEMEKDSEQRRQKTQDRAGKRKAQLAQKKAKKRR